MQKNMLLIVNPKAGKGTIKRKLPKIIKNFSDEGYFIETCYTRKDYKPKDILKDHKDVKLDLVVCCGGDGTLNELINTVMKMENKPQISFIPLGTMNDFARTIRMSTNKIFLSKHINESRLIKSDIGSFNNVYFNYVAAFGSFTAVPYVTPHKLKKIFGKIAYFIVGIIYIGKIRSYNVKIKVNGKEYNDRVIYGSVSNSKSIGGFEWFKRKGIKINDGKFEVLFIKRPKNLIGWINTLALLAIKKHKSKYFYYFQTDKIEIESEQKLAWTLDRRIWRT